ncbi:hypothetical protein O181_015428 [Austropuccinia psidii MF-1]|uniref:RRM domain-containing protein n=1 Tax=Austropuccinia psidii MF-1 TaxID=1389203 RepID=A0A9Q3C2G2_9BASI|nr:hypothetical protein [Austropuccinia psidii MF-1]
MASVMSYGHGSAGFRSHDHNRTAAAAAARSVQAHRVYIGNLPYAIGWRELKDFMREAGEVTFAEVLMGPDGRSKGCGVVEYSSGEGAQKAIAELSDKPLLGRPVFIREDRETQPRYGHQPQRNSYPSPGFSSGAARQLFISGLALTVTWRTLKDLFRQAGTVLRADVNAGKGTGIILMSTDAEATNAIATFNGTNLEGARIVVREDRYATNHHPTGNHQFHNHGSGYGASNTHFQSATRPPPVDPANQQPSTQLFVNNLPYTTDSAALLALCPGALNAEVLAVGNRSKGMGILEFATLEAAAEALSSLQAQVIGGRPLMPKYNERWHEFSDQAAGITPL